MIPLNNGKRVLAIARAFLFIKKWVVNMAKTGRPKKKIDKKQFETLCGIMCTEEEIASIFDCSVDTINNWCKATYKDEQGNPLTFSDVSKRKQATGKASLRRYQFKLAERNAAMAIFLGKQYLGQRDQIEQQAESPHININISAATAEDISED